MPRAHDRWPTGSRTGGVIVRLRVGSFDVLGTSDDLAITADCINPLECKANYSATLYCCICPLLLCSCNVRITWLTNGEAAAQTLASSRVVVVGYPCTVLLCLKKVSPLMFDNKFHQMTRKKFSIYTLQRPPNNLHYVVKFENPKVLPNVHVEH